MAYIDDVFDLAENSGDRLANEWHRVEESGLSNEDAEELLMNTNEL